MISHNVHANNSSDKALTRQHKLNQIPAPTECDLAEVQILLHSSAMSPRSLLGADSETWGSLHFARPPAPDLVGLCPRKDVDALSRMISQSAVNLFRRCYTCVKKVDRRQGNSRHDGTVLRAAEWFTSLMASLLPVISILVLANQKSEKTKLWTVAAFNVAITVCLMVCTNAPRAQVLAITAA